MKKLLTIVEESLYGRIALQPLFESLHRIGLRGMNYMQSQAINKTGEINAMKYALSRHQPEDGYILFDVGANEGQFVQEMNKVFSKKFKKYSFEPSQKAYEKLCTNVKANNTDYYNFGFGSEEKQVELYNSGGLFASLYPLNDSNPPGELISLKTIDCFCSEHSIETIFYLKIDVEGGELEALKGSKQMLDKRAIRFVQFEYGPNCMKAKFFLKDIFMILKDYRIYRIVRNGLRHLKYDETLEIPLTGNFLAELKS